MLQLHIVSDGYTPADVNADLRLILHDLELLGKLVELLVDVHHSYRRVGHLPSFGVYSLFTKIQAWRTTRPVC